MKCKSTGVYISKAVAPPKRTRNAAATREAILHSALAAFSRHGYDGIGVREIAQAAGVTAVLVNRYFGSKEELFSAAVEAAFSDSTLFEGDSSSLAQRLTEAVIAKTEKDAHPIDPLLLLLRSAPNPRAAGILRESIARHFERPLKSSLTGPWPSERAAMILAFISGLQLFRKVIGSKALTEGTRAGLYEKIKATFQRLIDRD
jgi:AcrR family transcriptional regulator